MSVRNVTLSGVVTDQDKKPLGAIPVVVHALTDLFKTANLAQTTTSEEGKYQVEFPISSLNTPIVLTSSSSFLKKFMLMKDDHPEVNIRSPSTRQKKRKLNPPRTSREPQRLTYEAKSSSFDAVFKSSCGRYWKEQVVKTLPNITTESLQKEFRPNPIPLSSSEEIAFLKNSLFFNPPHIDVKTRTQVYEIASFAPQHPEARITLRDHLTLTLHKVALKYPGEDWVEALPQDPHFSRFLYLANSAALFEGLTSNLLYWEHTLPSRYAQAFLTAVSEQNPIKKLLGAIFNDAYLIERHLGLQETSLLSDLILSTGVEKTEMLNQQVKNLRLNLYSKRESKAPSGVKLLKESAFHRRQYDLSKQVDLFRTQVIFPVLEEFFEGYANDLTDPYFREVEKLLATFDYLEHQARHPEALEAEPLKDPGIKYRKGALQTLKEWCAEALMVSIFYPFAYYRSLEYLTDLRFASLHPENRALTAEGEFDPYGGTSPVNASKQLSRVQLMVKKKRPHLMHLAHLYEPLKFRLEHSRESLLEAGIDLDRLTT